MEESVFTALSKRQMMLLLTAVTFGGPDATDTFAHLPDEEGELLKERAGVLLQIPREKRIPLLVQEIKRLVTARRTQLWAADPSRLAALLSKERAALIELVLRALPANIADAVRAQLPRTKVKFRREVKPEIFDVIRSRLEQMLTRAQKNRAIFKFSDILLLQSRELITVCDRVGARRLCKAVSGLPEADREQFLQKLPPDQRRSLTKALDHYDRAPLPEDQAREVLARHGVDQGPHIAIQRAGVQRLARACLAQSPEFAARVIERHHGEFGQLLAASIREERRDPPQGDGGRSDVVKELERLERQGIIDRPLRLPPPPKKAPLGGRLVTPPVPRSRTNSGSMPQRSTETTNRERNPLDSEEGGRGSRGRGPRGPTGGSG